MLKFFLKNIKVQIKHLLNLPVSLNELTFSYLKPNYTVLEAGAHDGSDTMRLAVLTKNKVYAIEPVPVIFEQLKKRVSSTNNIVPFNIALSDTTGRMPMYISGGGSDASSSLLKPAEHLNKNPEVTFDETIYVDALTLDDWALANGIKKIDFMWLDMQGYEFSMLKKSKVIFPTLKVLYTEISITELYKAQGLYLAYKEWLIGSGFKLMKEDLPWEFTGNALFIRI